MKLTTKNLCAIFEVGPMTIYNWRKPLKTSRKEKLPHEVKKLSGGKVAVSFQWNAVRLWAKRNKVEVKFTPKELKVQGRL